jgi:hypothetical protein
MRGDWACRQVHLDDVGRGSMRLSCDGALVLEAGDADE